MAFAAHQEPAAESLQLVPRLKDQGYERDDLDARREWVEQRCGAALPNVGTYSFAPRELRGNIENAVGAAQVPLGIAGPLMMRGEHAKGTFYVPLATTEGALVRSYERGMMTLSRSGGVEARVHRDENRIAPLFSFDSIGEAFSFAAGIPAMTPEIIKQAEGTTRHGRLLRVEPQPVGREVILNFCFHTGDAHGMNMIARAAERACEWLMCNTCAKSYLLFSGFESEKHLSGFAMAGGKGKTVTAGAFVPAEVLRSYLHTTAGDLHELWRKTVTGHLRAHAAGYNGHFANGLAALYIACGQDVANVVNSSAGITSFELTGTGLYASVTLTSLTVATIGGGTSLGTARECLALIDCYGKEKAAKLAEIAAGTLLAGELSIAAALCSGEFVRAHEQYGRNRPALSGGET